MLKKSILLLITVLLLSVGVVSAGSWSGPQRVTNIYQYSTGEVYLQFEYIHNPQSCSVTNWVRVAASNAARKEIYSMLLASFMSETPVNYYVDGCLGNYPLVHHVQIAK